MRSIKLICMIIVTTVCLVILTGSYAVLASETPGQVLKISKVVPGGNDNKYTVQKGDTLDSIAKKYSIAASTLRVVNGISTDSVVAGQTLTIPVIVNKSLKNIISEKGIQNPEGGIQIFVDKSDHTLSIIYKGVWLKSYHIELGEGGLEDKEILGDRKTPEGSFYISEKYILNPPDQYLGTRWMRLSYPNIEDAKRGIQNNIIDKDTYNAIVDADNNGTVSPQESPLGGAVGIHGGSNPEFGSDWTWGCVGLKNKDVEDFYDFVSVGTRVIIQL